MSKRRSKRRRGKRQGVGTFTLAFGKYSGKPISRVPVGYLRWALKLRAFPHPTSGSFGSGSAAEGQFAMSSPSALETALVYANCGHAVVPLWKPTGSHCSCRRGCDCDRPGKHPRTRNGVSGASSDEKRIRSWRWETANVGIATGERSGLAVLDVDPRNRGYIELSKLIGRLGKLPEGPTSFTGGRGLHLFFKYPGVKLRAQACNGVDIKADGGYVVAPRSLHANGREYVWLRDLESELPSLPRRWVEYLQGGVLQRQRDNKDYKDHKDNKDNKRHPPRGIEILNGESVREFVEHAIQESLPRSSGERHRRVFYFARLLKGHPVIGSSSLQLLRPWVDEWYRRGLESVGEPFDASRDDNWLDFAEGWGEVKFPGADGFLQMMLHRASLAPVPQVAQDFDTPELILLVSWCRELQRHAKGEPFELSSYKVAELLSIRPMRANRWLRSLVPLEILTLEKQGDWRKKKANLWRYLPNLDE